LLEAAAGVRLQRVLLMPLGFALIVVVSLITTNAARTAHLTTPIVVGLAIGGFALALPVRPSRADIHLAIWPGAAAAAVYAAIGAPVIFSGSATFPSYITLDDTATWLGFADRLLQHGRNTTGLAPSSYEAALQINLIQNGYPAGAFPPLGIVHELLATDSAWLFQPYVAFLGAMLALALYGVTTHVIAPRPLRAFAAFIAAQSALLYGYSQWGGVKEMASAALLVLLAALTPPALQKDVRARNLLPLATATAALLGVLSLDGGVWVAPILLPALIVGVRLRRRTFIWLAASFVVATAILSVPTLRLTRFQTASVNGLTTADLGNLITPLNKLQVFGIWPVGDFRFRPHNIHLTYVLIGLVAVAAVGGLVWAWRCREWGLLLYVAGASVGCAVSVALGSPWIDGKALAIASPAALIAAAAATGWLFAKRRRVEATVAVLVIAGGVLWSNTLAYREVWLAPRTQLRELETIGTKFPGQGPALMTEYSPFGVRHFLRSMDPEGVSELRRRPDLLRGGGEVPKGGYADIDQFQLDGLLVYRTLVLIHSPSSSRPPSNYHLVWSGTYYDVWQRPVSATSRILEHVPLGTYPQPAAVPPCSEVLRVGRVAAAAHGRVAAVIRPGVVVVDLAAATIPSTWQPASDDPGAVYPAPSGTLQAAVSVQTTGRYGFWLEGSFRRHLDLFVDNRKLASAQNRLVHPGVDTPLGQAVLAAGLHGIVLRYSPATFSPGTAGSPFALGPLVLARFTANRPVTYVRPANARSLCGKSLDWIEAVRP
jgi:hypothetical protein